MALDARNARIRPESALPADRASLKMDRTEVYVLLLRKFAPMEPFVPNAPLPMEVTALFATLLAALALVRPPMTAPHAHRARSFKETCA